MFAVRSAMLMLVGSLVPVSLPSAHRLGDRRRPTAAIDADRRCLLARSPSTRRPLPALPRSTSLTRVHAVESPAEDRPGETDRSSPKKPTWARRSSRASSVRSRRLPSIARPRLPAVSASLLNAARFEPVLRRALSFARCARVGAPSTSASIRGARLSLHRLTRVRDRGSLARRADCRRSSRVRCLRDCSCWNDRRGHQSAMRSVGPAHHRGFVSDLVQMND